MIDQKERRVCSGCTVCVAACPQNCIEKRVDERGFKYPQIDHNVCTQCGLCDKVCEAAATKADTAVTPKAYGAYAKNQQLRFDSSSGGVFTLLAEKILEEKGGVVGAAFSQ